MLIVNAKNSSGYHIKNFGLFVLTILSLIKIY
jgi:hypothetical protein